MWRDQRSKHAVLGILRSVAADSSNSVVGPPEEQPNYYQLQKDELAARLQIERERLKNLIKVRAVQAEVNAVEEEIIQIRRALREGGKVRGRIRSVRHV